MSPCRDLKPSNIFLKDDMSLAIGDFGVATVMMGNTKDVTRTTVGKQQGINYLGSAIVVDVMHNFFSLRFSQLDGT